MLAGCVRALNPACGCAAAFDASYVLAFMLAGTFLVYSVLILVMRNVFVREQQQGKLAPNKADQATAAPVHSSAATEVRRSSLLRSQRCVCRPRCD